VDHGSEQVRVPAVGDCGEEVAADDLAPVGDTGPSKQLARLGRDSGLVEQHAADLGVPGQDGREHRAPSAADVDDGREPAEVVGVDDRIGCRL
jgi:hypothetical protein